MDLPSARKITFRPFDHRKKEIAGPTMADHRNPENRTITIFALVDTVAALNSNTLHGALHLMDNNRNGGSRRQGTDSLITRVEKGNRLVWQAVSIEAEAFVQIADIDVDPGIVEVEKRVFPGTDIVFWTGVVKEGAEKVPYSIAFLLGTRKVPLVTESFPLLEWSGSTITEN
jgi:hypothetical protein